MKRRLVVLVTGAGGVYGEATVASLRRCSLDVRIIGADRHWHAPGSLASDVPVVLPNVDAPDYVARLVDVARTHAVDAVFVCSGTEIRALVDERDRLERETGACFVLPGAALYRLASDKLETSRFLAAGGLAHPETVLSTNEEEVHELARRVGYPLFAKPRFGQGSRGLFVCRSPDDVARVRALGEPYVFQELIGDDDHEYTVGVVGTEEGEVLGSIVLRRWLAAGQTGACVVEESAEIGAYAEAIAARARPRGYLNVQLRLRGGRPVAFELNARVSSSTGFRTLAGFNEAELLLRRYVLGETPARPTVSRIAMARGLQERVVDPAVWSLAAPRG